MSSVAATSDSTIRTLEELNKNTRTSGSSLGQDAFLKLLAAQMANQDPLEPTSNEDFLAQMAQFTMLEQINEMGESFSTSQAYSMISKYVYVQDGEDLVFGKVDGVVKENGINYLMIGGEMYDTTKVVGIVDSTEDTGLDEKILRSASLIGQTVTATVTAADGTKTTITGEVSRIVVKDDKIYAIVDGKEVPVSNITEISTGGTSEPPVDEAETPADDTELPTDTDQ